MTDREKLRATSCESLLACLRDRLRAFRDDASMIGGECTADEVRLANLRRDLKAAADRIDMKLRMERGE